MDAATASLLAAAAGAALFTVLAGYCSMVDTPARRKADVPQALAIWRAHFKAMGMVQVPAALLAIGASFTHAALKWQADDAAAFFTRRFALAGGAIFVAIFVYTIFVIGPVNRQLQDSAADDRRGPQRSRALIERWDALHALRSVLAMMALGSLVCALAGGPSGKA